jgi:hypothetical protein
MAKGKSNGVRRGFIGYASYMFKEKDPAIDELRTVIQTEHGDINRKVLKKIHEEGGPSDATSRMGQAIAATSRSSRLRVSRQDTPSFAPLP